MFKVPADSSNPTWQDTYTVSFWKHLTSSKAERLEWKRLRDAATAHQHKARMDRVTEWGEEQKAKREARKKKGR